MKSKHSPNPQCRLNGSMIILIFTIWRLFVQRALAQLNSLASPKEIYRVLKEMLARFSKSNNHIQAKVRQTLQRYPEFRSDKMEFIYFLLLSSNCLKRSLVFITDLSRNFVPRFSSRVLGLSKGKLPSITLEL